jgi:hypothetical protein
VNNRMGSLHNLTASRVRDLCRSGQFLYVTCLEVDNGALVNLHMNDTKDQNKSVRDRINTGLNMHEI